MRLAAFGVVALLLLPGSWLGAQAGPAAQLGGTGAASIELAGSAQPAAATGASPFHGLVPSRLLDTRPGSLTIDGVGQGGGAVSGGSAAVVQVTGRAGIPVTGVGGGCDPTSRLRRQRQADVLSPPLPTVSGPVASNMNPGPGDTVANAVVVALGPGGAYRPVQLRRVSSPHRCVSLDGSTRMPLPGWRRPDSLDTRPGSPTRRWPVGRRRAVGGGLVDVPI